MQQIKIHDPRNVLFAEILRFYDSLKFLLGLPKRYQFRRCFFVRAVQSRSTRRGRARVNPSASTGNRTGIKKGMQTKADLLLEQQVREEKKRVSHSRSSITSGIPSVRKMRVFAGEAVAAGLATEVSADGWLLLSGRLILIATGWEVAVTLTVITLIYNHFTPDDLENWLSNSPFGTSPISGWTPEKQRIALEAALAATGYKYLQTAGPLLLRGRITGLTKSRECYEPFSRRRTSRRWSAPRSLRLLTILR